jgi:hypothetical protein
MNLIEKFENAPFQDVGTFNAIFPWTPILGFDASTEVKIGKIVTDSERLVFANEVELRMDLIAPKKAAIKKIKPEVRKKTIKPTKGQPLELSAPFKELSFGEFFTYKALMEIGQITTLEAFSSIVGVDRKSMTSYMRNLIKKGYVEKTTVYKGISRD